MQANGNPPWGLGIISNNNIQEARQEARCAAADLHKQLPEKLQLARALACEKGASSWLTTLPLKVHGFELPKGSFRDVLCLRYGWQVPQLPTTCVCGSAMEVEHALSCRFGGLPIRCHNEVRNLLASCLTRKGRLWNNHRTATPATFWGSVPQENNHDGPRCAPGHQGQWILGGGSEEAFFDVRVFNPFTPSYRSLPIPSTYLRHEKEKRDRYEERVREVERAAFTPLVFAATGGASRLTTTFLKRLAACMADQSGEAYSTTMAWLRARLAFSLLRSAVACLRSSRRRVAVDSEDLQPGLAIDQASTCSHW